MVGRASATPDILRPLDPSAHSSEIVVSCGTRSFTRSDFWNLVAGDARRLQKVGAGPGDRVAIASENCHVALSGFFAALAAGAIAVPLNVRLAPPELAAILDDASPAAVLCHPEQVALLRSSLELAAIAPPLLTAQLEPPRAQREWSPIPHGSTIAIFYTGGSTGQPKGVQITAGNFVANATHFASIVDSQPGMRYLHLPPFFHLADAGVSMLVHLSGGHHVFIGMFEPRRAAAALDAGVADWTDVIPTMLQRMLAEPLSPGHRTSRLRAIIYGGAPMPLPVVQKAIARYGPVLIQTYGLSEATSLVTALTADDHIDALESRAPAGRLGSCGKPVPGVEVEMKRKSSEILVSGPNVMAGYWRRPEESAHAVREGWLHTGDVGRFDDDGYLYLVGRIRDVIISGGENVYAGEVERVLRAVPGVIEAAVVGIPDERWGERVHAAIHVDGTFDNDAAQSLLSRKLARFKHPKSWSLRDSELPRTPIGKIDKRRILDQALAEQGVGNASSSRATDLGQRLGASMLKGKRTA